MKYLPYILGILAVIGLYMAYVSNQKLKALEAKIKSPCGCDGSPGGTFQPSGPGDVSGDMETAGDAPLGYM